MRTSTLEIRTARRRQRSSRDERQQWVEDWERSGLTQVEYARTHGLSVATLRNWIRHAARATAVSGSGAPEFREVDLAQVLGVGANVADRSWDAEIRMPSGVAIAVGRGTSAARVRELLEAVGC